jgi:poly-gamma-glutamate capsule biosynthesis protein CapA/YwtB (metallophosphatase superfamily)
MLSRRFVATLLVLALTTAAFGTTVVPAMAFASGPAGASETVEATLPSVTVSVESSPSVEASLTLLAVGDLMAHIAQLKAARRGNSYSFVEAFARVAPTISAADLAVGNLETTLSNRSYSGYPGFKTPRQYADALKGAGFDVLSTANNHSLDGGARGVRYTTSYLDLIGIRHFGTNNPSPIIVERNGIKIAFASYTYATNGIRSPFAAAVNRLKLSRIRADIQAVKPNVDAVVVFMHWGSEYRTSVESSTRSQGRYIIDSGADLVLGSHPHVIRPVEKYNGHYIVYSMGNFVSGMSRSLTDLGTMVTVKMTKEDTGVVAVSDLRVLPVYRDRTPGAGRRTYRAVLIDDALARPDKWISKADKSKMKTYRSFCRRMYGAYCY